MDKKKILALVELIIVIALVIFDLGLPSLFIVIVGILFIRLRKEKFTFLVEKKYTKIGIFILSMFGLGVLLSVFDYCIVIPLLNHITGTKQNMNVFADLKGNEQLLCILLAYSWIIAAIIEEFAYRGFFQNRIISLFSNRTAGIMVAVIGSSAFFGFMHIEQGIVGIVNTATDALILSLIRYKTKNIWASVLVHGFSNMLGILTFYFVGPVYGLW